MRAFVPEPLIIFSLEIMISKHIISIIIVIHNFLIYYRFVRKDVSFDGIFVMNVFILRVWGGYKSCQISVDIIGLRVPTLKLRDALLFRVSLPSTNCPTARRHCGQLVQ